MQIIIFIYVIYSLNLMRKRNHLFLELKEIFLLLKLLLKATDTFICYLYFVCFIKILQCQLKT